MTKIIDWIFKNIQIVIILVLVGIVFLQKSCQSPPITDDPNTVTINKKHYEYLKSHIDTVYRTEHIYYKGNPIPGDIIYIPIPTDEPIDTTKILQDYFSKVPYSETVKIFKDNYDFGTLTVNDTVYKNRLFHRDYRFDLIIPEINTTIVVKELPKRQLFIGAGLNFDNINIINSIYTGIMYKDRKDHLFGINLGISTQFDQKITPYVGGSMYWKISLKKKQPKYHKVGVKSAQFILDNL